MDRDKEQTDSGSVEGYRSEAPRVEEAALLAICPKQHLPTDCTSDTNPAVQVFCIAGRGYYWYKPNEPAEKWIKHLPSQDYEEVVEFIGGVASTIPGQIVAKGRPRFGEYIIRPRDFVKL